MPTLKLIVDNNAPGALLGEHGLSTLIESDGRRILLDTGQGAALEHNASALGVDLTELDAIVLSHGHYDHTGALPQALEKAPEQCTLFLHPAALKRRFSIRDGIAKDISITDAARRAVESLPPSRIHYIENPSEILPGILLSGEIGRMTDFEDTGGPFFLDAEGTSPDMIEDDMSLCLDTPEGAVICLGCCHSGIVNTLRHFGRKNIRAIVGGMHLKEASNHRMRETAAALRDEFAIDRLIPTHCTGDDAADFLSKALPRRVESGFAGMTLEF